MRNSVFVTALLVLVLGCGSAWAAGPAATATYNWTGFYVGLNAGLAANNSDYSGRPSGAISELAEYYSNSGNFDNAACTIGGQLGYNYQVGCVVLGLETDLNYDSSEVSNYSSTLVLISPLVDVNSSVSQKLDYFGTLRGRVGFTPTDRLLIYGTGGLAYGEVSSSRNTALVVENFETLLTATGSSTETQIGWAVGAGGEYALSNCWSLKLEYLYMDLGSRSYTYPAQYMGTTIGTGTTTIDSAQHIIRVGINYKF